MENGSRFNSPDTIYDEVRLKPGSGTEKRAFTYFVLGGARFLYASAARLAVINAVATLSASADVLALAAVEVDLSNIQPGQTITVKWRGKPVFIKNRTAEQIAEVAAPVADLRHQQTDLERVKNPQWLIVLGVCTHLGCVPISNAGDWGGWVSAVRCNAVLGLGQQRSYARSIACMVPGRRRTLRRWYSHHAPLLTPSPRPPACSTALATAATMTARGASAAGRRRSTWRCPSTSSSRRTSWCWAKHDARIRHAGERAAAAA